MKQFLYKFVVFSLLLQTSLHGTVTTDKVNCGDSNISRESEKLCTRNKVLEKYSRIESLKKEILSKLGLNEAPNVTAPRTLPASMVKDFSSLQAASSTTRTPPYYAMPINTHSVSQTRHKFGISHSKPKQSTIYAYSYLLFNITIESKHQNIYRAKLVFKLGKELSLTPEFPTNVHKLLLYAEHGEKEVVVAKQGIRAVSDTYTLDITKYIQSLVKKKSRHARDVISLGFSLRIAVLKNNKKITRLVDETREPARILVQSYDERDVETRRSRRAASLRYCSGRNEENCCVRSLEINFREDLGWDYIASPPSFNANYCDGSCPLNWHTENNLFYDILYKYAAKNNRHIGPCCVPNEYESLNIIYFNQHNEPIVAKLPNVIVRSCSCR